MHADGWIPREQILGAEAVAKVPDWAVSQHRTHANPPTLLLAIESLLQHAPSDDEATISWLMVLFPALEQWFAWFRTTQAGEEPGTFRWRGRDASDGKLNAMTLSSGLDDYPRASKVSDAERHVDLYSWIAHGAGVLARVGERAGLDATKVAEYKNLHNDMVAALDKWHWDDKRNRYCDHGLHANQGAYVAHIVVKCGTEDGSNSVEHTLTGQQWQQLQQGHSSAHRCPAKHPKFLFPLGDGQGGLMTRELFVPKNEKKQFVDHTGYVSLFPFFLRLIPASSPNLQHVLKTLSDTKSGLWSDFGLRSLAPKDRMYLRENAPGDAPYWRGPIWINCNFLAIHALRHYAAEEGPYRETAAKLLEELSHNLITNIFNNYKETGFLWEQYNPKDGKGQRTHPFNGWSSLVVLMMS
jgi:mannosyl-oligosaccharide glucosidase